LNTIPESILKPLGNTCWRYDDHSVGKFAWAIDLHAQADKRSGLTCRYAVGQSRGDSEGLTRAEFDDIAAEGAIRPEFHRDGGVNQHWQHSLEQFYAVAYREWRAHQARTDALLGTSAGRISRA